jgi:hypothetical protein
VLKCKICGETISQDNVNGNGPAAIQIPGFVVQRDELVHYCGLKCFTWSLRASVDTMAPDKVKVGWPGE